MTDLAGVKAGPTPATCPVCRAAAPQPFQQIGGRDYWKCNVCKARFLDPQQRPSRQDEYSHYLTHENAPGDARYRTFLAKLADPLLARLGPGLGSGLEGLDYGCGPGPALAQMLGEAGHAMSLYDPFFFPDKLTLCRTYDFITCTETAEHFHEPAKEFDRLNALLRPGGWLGVMTSFQTDDALFANWHYVKDPTHVVFYREATLHTIAAQRGWSCEIPIKDVALMRKSVGPGLHAPKTSGRLL